MFDNFWFLESFYHFGHFWQYLTILQSLTTLDKTTTKIFGKTHSKSDPWDLWPFRRLFLMIRRQDLTNIKIMTKTKTMTATKRMWNLWPLRHWQLRTWIDDNLCDLTINSDTRQHLQFLQCFFILLTFQDNFIKCFGTKIIIIDYLICYSYNNND